MKKYKYFFIIFFVFLGIFFSNTSYAMSQSLNNLNFDIKILDNGNVSVTEIWDINLEDTNTLFKTFNKDSKFKEITDVTVTELDKNGNEIKTFNNSWGYRYHEPKDYFHATNDESGNFEIAWGVSAQGTEHRYFKLDYTILNCINVYNDCAEFYWQVLGNKWNIETFNITGTVMLPSEVNNYDDFRVWAHGPLHGAIHKIGNNSCFFSIKNMPTYTFLELRLVFPPNIVNETTSINNTDKLNEILKEEQANADKANRKRNSAKSLIYVSFSLGIIVSCIFGFFSIKKLIKIIKEYNQLNFFKDNFDYKYFRDIPNNKLDPVEATILAFKEISYSNIISSLLMSLAYKKIIFINPGDTKQNTEISINPNYSDINYLNDNTTDLTDGEKDLIRYLEKIGKTFSMQKFEKYTTTHSESFYNMLKRISSHSSDNIRNKYKYIDINLENFREKVLLRSYATFILIFIYLLIVICFYGFMSFNLGIILAFVIFVVELIYIFSTIYLSKISKKLNIYTETGTEERAKWQGLKNFMMNFSLLDEREIPELELWEQYLVYATGFGIAKKVIKKLKTKYPELSNSDYYMSNSCFYIANNHTFSNTVNKSVNSAVSIEISKSSSSSGSGGGGGFSSGGGGGRWWRPVVAEDKS